MISLVIKINWFKPKKNNTDCYERNKNLYALMQDVAGSRDGEGWWEKFFKKQRDTLGSHYNSTLERTGRDFDQGSNRHIVRSNPILK